MMTQPIHYAIYVSQLETAIAANQSDIIRSTINNTMRRVTSNTSASGLILVAVGKATLIKRLV